MHEPPGDDVTRLLRAAQDGDTMASAQLTELVYPHLKLIAEAHLRRERPAHTLQATALVHEALLRTAGYKSVEWQNREHFYAWAAKLMRLILVDYARRRHANKRGSGRQHEQLQDWQVSIEDRPDLVLEVDRLLARLASVSERQVKVVEMRYFAGFSEAEIAQTLGVSDRTIKRDWRMARAWLRKELAAT